MLPLNLRPSVKSSNIIDVVDYTVYALLINSAALEMGHSVKKPSELWLEIGVWPYVYGSKRTQLIIVAQFYTCKVSEILKRYNKKKFLV